ncbi:MAG: MFS transporter [Myxococcota bacterium]
MPRESTKGTLPVLFSVVVLDLIGFGIVLPVLPFYARAYGAGGFELGALLTSFAAFQFLCAPFWGRLSDRIGRRPVMIITIAGTGLSLLWLGLADSMLDLFAARILAGVFAANISVATAYVTDVTEESERTRWMGMIGASYAVGFVAGPAIGGLLSPTATELGLRFTLIGGRAAELLSPFGYGIPMLFASALAALNLVWAALSLREPPGHVRGEGSGLPRRETLRNPIVLRLCTIYFLFSLAVTQLESLFAFWMLDRFGYGARQVATLLVAMAIVMGGIQGGAMRHLSRSFGERKLLLSGTFLLAVALATLPLAASVTLLLLPLLGCALGRAISHPAMLSMVSLAASPETRGSVMGTFQSSASLARVLGPIGGGVLYDLSGSAPFLLAAVLMIGSASLARRLPAGEKSASEPPA